MKTEKDTKTKILEAADDLFARLGFAGTSVREIASLADVNLAAINYHFKNKENLYWEVFEYNHDLLDVGVRKIGAKTETTAELAVGVFKFFVSGKSALMNTFKIFLSNTVKLPDEGVMSETGEGEQFGPPGEKVFLEKIRHDLGEEISKEGQDWAVTMIFSLLVHFAVVSQTEVMKRKCQKRKELRPENLEASLAMSVHAHLDYLNNNPNLFK